MKRCVIGGLMVLIAVALGLVSPAAAQTRVVVGTAVAKSFQFVPLWIGRDLGFFKKHGLDVVPTPFAGGAKMQAAVAAGSVDMYLDSGPGVAGAVAQGLKTKIIAATETKPTLMVVIVGPQSGVTRVEDLRGKKLGVTSHGALTDWFAKRLSLHMGWDPEKGIERVALGPFPNQVAALKRGHTHGFLWTVEGALEMEEKGEGKILLNFGEILKEFQFGVIAARDAYIQEKTDAVRAFLKGWYEAIQWMKEHRDEAVSRIARQLEISEGVARKTYDLDITNLSTDGTPHMPGLQFVAASVPEMGFAPRAPDVKEIFDGRFVPVRLER